MIADCSFIYFLQIRKILLNHVDVIGFSLSRPFTLIHTHFNLISIIHNLATEAVFKWHLLDNLYFGLYKLSQYIVPYTIFSLLDYIHHLSIHHVCSAKLHVFANTYSFMVKVFHLHLKDP